MVFEQRDEAGECESTDSWLADTVAEIWNLKRMEAKQICVVLGAVEQN